MMRFTITSRFCIAAVAFATVVGLGLLATSFAAPFAAPADAPSDAPRSSTPAAVAQSPSSAANAAATPNAAGLELFERDVRPIFVDTCQQCHGVKKQEGDLRLDSREAALRGGASGPAIVPAQPEKSLLVDAIHQQGDYKMPPKSKLSDGKIAAIEHWIKLGAPWPASDAPREDRAALAKTHWAFQPITDPPVPHVANISPQPANPIDAFIVDKRAAAGLVPSPRASRRELIRRATVDLTGGSTSAYAARAGRGRRVRGYPGRLRR
jgi:cytochrome c553